MTEPDTPAPCPFAEALANPNSEAHAIYDTGQTCAECGLSLCTSIAGPVCANGHYARRPEPAADAVEAVAELVTLNACPPGLFLFGDTLGFKSEYTTTLENPRRYQCDAYCVESGEYFWGGAKNTEDRGKLMVQPLARAAIAAMRGVGERAAIVEWLQKQAAARISGVGGIMSGGGRDYDIGRATGYQHAADCISKGQHLPPAPAKEN